MKSLLAATFMFLLALAGHGVQAPASTATITDVNGNVYKNVDILSKDPTGLLILYSKGPRRIGTKLYFSQLPQETRTAYGYTEDTERQYREERAESLRRHEASMRQAEQLRIIQARDEQARQQLRQEIAAKTAELRKETEALSRKSQQQAAAAEQQAPHDYSPWYEQQNEALSSKSQQQAVAAEQQAQQDYSMWDEQNEDPLDIQPRSSSRAPRVRPQPDVPEYDALFPHTATSDSAVRPQIGSSISPPTDYRTSFSKPITRFLSPNTENDCIVTPGPDPLPIGSSWQSFNSGAAVRTTQSPLERSSRARFDDGTTARTTYNQFGNTSRTTFDDGTTARTTYNQFGNTSRTTFDDGTTSRTTYNPFGNTSRTTFGR